MCSLGILIEKSRGLIMQIFFLTLVVIIYGLLTQLKLIEIIELLQQNGNTDKNI